MCAFCDEPTLTYPEYLARMARLADEYGWAVQGVERDRHRPPWAYTVGGPVAVGARLPRAARRAAGAGAADNPLISRSMPVPIMHIVVTADRARNDQVAM
jgi:hypothetical protein